MAKWLQMRDDLRRIVKALHDLPGEPPRRALHEREAELATVEKEIANYTDQLNSRFTLRVNWTEKPGGRISGEEPPPGPQAVKMPRTFVFEKKATSLVFVCDASGSMVQKFASVKEQLNRAIGDLDVQQSFTFIFLQEKPLAFSGGQLV